MNFFKFNLKKKVYKKQKFLEKRFTQSKKANISKPKQWVPPFSGTEKHVLTNSNNVDFKKTLPISTKTNEINKIISSKLHTHDISTEDKKEFLKIFRKLTFKWRSWDIWTDFITMAACSISNVVDKNHFNEREEIYLRTIKKYSKEEQTLFPEMFARLVLAFDKNPEQDFLGEIYTELGLNSKERQQIFTPYSISHMMAEITLGNIVEQVKEKDVITINDCCCGGGSTLIAAVNVAKNKLIKEGLNYQHHILVVGQDIDSIATMMCYIQLSLLGVAGYFKVGNSITQPIIKDENTDNYWFTPMYFFPIWNYKKSPKQKEWINNGRNISL